FERQGHLVGTATGPLPVGPAKGSSLSILTEPQDELAPFHTRSPRRRYSRNGEVSRGRSVETSLEHADERDLIETFVERSRWHCRAASETFSTDEFRPVTTVLASTT